MIGLLDPDLLICFYRSVSVSRFGSLLFIKDFEKFQKKDQHFIIFNELLLIEEEVASKGDFLLILHRSETAKNLKAK